MDKILENIPTVINSIQFGYESVIAVKEVPNKCSELKGLLQQMKSMKRDMLVQLKEDKADNPCKKQRDYVGTIFEQMGKFQDKADKTLEDHEKWSLSKRIRMCVGPQLNNNLKEGKRILNKADQLMKEGLTCYEDYTRGMRLPVVELVGNTAQERRAEALRFIKRGAQIIGVHGILGTGKTNFMRHLHNDVHSDPVHYKAVFWAGAPQEQQPDIKSLQDCIAEAIQFKFEDEDVTRRSGLLAAKLKDLAPGHVVLFLDNVKEAFQMQDVGIPIGCKDVEGFCCTLVFTTASEDVCNKMYCSTKFKMDILPEPEARELFLHQAGWDTHYTQIYGQKIEKIVDDVVKQCTCFPLVITLIARSMTGKEDICEWNNRLNELKGILKDMDGDEAKILEQLKFSFNGIKDRTVRSCFLDAATVLYEGVPLTKQSLIQHWVQKGRISSKRFRGACPTASILNYQGHTIINELNRAYLLEVVELNGEEFLSMNKWIRKMAEKITQEGDGHNCDTFQLSQGEGNRS